MTNHFIAEQPNFSTGAKEFFLGENVPVHHHGHEIGWQGQFIAGPFESADKALDALAETSTPDAMALESELRRIRPDWF